MTASLAKCADTGARNAPRLLAGLLDHVRPCRSDWSCVGAVLLCCPVATALSMRFRHTLTPMLAKYRFSLCLSLSLVGDQVLFNGKIWARAGMHVQRQLYRRLAHEVIEAHGAYVRARPLS